MILDWNWVNWLAIGFKILINRCYLYTEANDILIFQFKNHLNKSNINL